MWLPARDTTDYDGPRLVGRAAHPIELNATVLRKTLEGVFAIYDTPCGKVTPGRSTELSTDGLLRPGEIMPKTGLSCNRM